jgi:hypothetical protein
MILLLFFISLFFINPASSLAASCDASSVNKCGSDGGCPTGERCNLLLGSYSCWPDNSCGNNPGPAPTPPPSTGVYICNQQASDTACKGRLVNQSCLTSVLQDGICQPTTSSIYDDVPCTCAIQEVTLPTSPGSSNPSLPGIQPTDKECKLIEIDGQRLDKYDTVYPPNGLCYKKVSHVHWRLDNYPLSCSPIDKVIYEDESIVPVTTFKTVQVYSDFWEAELGGWGPSHALVTQNADPDYLATKYLFNALFDRPLVAPLTTESVNDRESFRTFWRMLTAYQQANFKAWYFTQVMSGNFTNTWYSFLDEEGKVHTTNSKELRSNLPDCLRKFPACPEFGELYLKLPKKTRASYDALLPYNFDNVRGYGVNVASVTKENLPYLGAIFSGSMSSVGLFSHYTPGGFIYHRRVSPEGFIVNEDTFGDTIPEGAENLLIPKVILSGQLNGCGRPEKSYGLPSPRTYPYDSHRLTQTVVIPVTSTLIEVSFGMPTKWKVYGEAKAKPIAILNNPLVAKINKRIYSNPQESFYHMLTPQDVASKVAEELIKAPRIKYSTNTSGASVDGSPDIYRHTNLPQDAMHVLQNCQFMPMSLARSPVCGTPRVAGCGLPPPPFNPSPACRIKNSLNLPPSLVSAIEEAGNAFNVPPALMVAVIFGEGYFNPGSPFYDESFVVEHMKSCAEIPGCNPGGPSVIFSFFKHYWDRGLGDAVKVFDPDREPNPCNILDGVFAVAKHLSQGKRGSPYFKNPLTGSPYSCFGIPLNTGRSSSTSVSCSDWTNSDIESAIRVWEFGTGYDSTSLSCATKANSCLLGGGVNAQCPAGDDNCETITNPESGGRSHNGCLWDKYQENK